MLDQLESQDQGFNKKKQFLIFISCVVVFAVSIIGYQVHKVVWLISGKTDQEAPARVLQPDIQESQISFKRDQPIDPAYIKERLHRIEKTISSENIQTKPLFSSDDSLAKYLSESMYSEAEKSKAILIPVGTILKARLMKPINSLVSDLVVAQLIAPGNDRLDEAVLRGRQSTLPHQDRIYVEFASITLKDGQEITIRAIAMGLDGQSGLIGKLDAKVRGSFIKSLAKGLVNVTMLAVDSSEAASVVRGATVSPISNIDTNQSVTVKRNARFDVFFEEGVSI